MIRVARVKVFILGGLLAWSMVEAAIAKAPAPTPEASTDGTVTGFVTGNGNAPLSPAIVSFYSPTGTFLVFATTAANGSYSKVLAPGSYFAKAFAVDSSYGYQLFDGQPCSAECLVTSGTPITVVAGATRSGVNFALQPAGSISGSVTDAVSGIPIDGNSVVIEVHLYAPTGEEVDFTRVDGNGTYTFNRLPTGTYFVRVYTFQGYADEVYNDLPCNGFCAVTAGTPVNVTAPNSTTGVNFALSLGGTITGTVTNSFNAAPLSNVTVNVYSSTGVLARAYPIRTSDVGTYTIAGLLPGTYFARTVHTDGYIDELFNNLPCVSSCTVTSGTPIVVTAGNTTSGIDFALLPGGRVAGSVTAAAGGAPLAGVRVGVYAANGALAGIGLTDGSGNYLIDSGLPTGTYYSRTFNTSGYIDELFDNVLPCSVSCLVTAGTPFGVTQGNTTSNINFALAGGTELIRNGDFSNGTAFWSLFATPNPNYLAWQAPHEGFEFYRVPPPPGTSNQAVILQQTGASLSAGAPLVAEFDLANTSGTRKRISVLLHDSNFGDLSVCTFWLPANSPQAHYGMRTYLTTAWLNATISFYAASEGSNGGFYDLDNVSLQSVPIPPTQRTDCIDPTIAIPSGGADGPELLTNGDFAAGMAGWSTFGQLVHQVTGGVFEFYRPSLNPDPAGVILQPTSTAVAVGGIVTAQLDLGNSSAVRKRVTVILHDLDFSDLSACTFWLQPGQALTHYTVRSFATRPWTNATISIYTATAGDQTWIRLDNVSFRQTPGTATSGTGCERQ